MVGLRFGIQTVVESAGIDKHGQCLWLTVCDCGSPARSVQGAKLRRGESTSCGCAKPSKCAAANTKHGASARGRMTPEYRAWSNMIDRCERQGNAQYADWGGRGISVCDQWRHDFSAFLADVGPRPSSAHSIDRVDVNGNYEPGNVRWATKTEQNINKRTTRMLTFDGMTLTVKEWAHRTGQTSHGLDARIRCGWTVERALMTPVRIHTRPTSTDQGSEKL